jgi:hypothetical protein
LGTPAATFDLRHFSDTYPDALLPRVVRFDFVGFDDPVYVLAKFVGKRAARSRPRL